ncbi:uncharacterized protein AAG666_006460 isoform 2-T2 [Megaptera novaeangliae]
MGKYISKRPRHAACGILVHRPGIEPGPPAVGVQSLNHWTARASVHAMRNKGNKKAGSVPTRIGIHFRNKGGHVGGPNLCCLLSAKTALVSLALRTVPASLVCGLPACRGRSQQAAEAPLRQCPRTGMISFSPGLSLAGGTVASWPLGGTVVSIVRSTSLCSYIPAIEAGGGEKERIKYSSLFLLPPAALRLTSQPFPPRHSCSMQPKGHYILFNLT